MNKVIIFGGDHYNSLGLVRVFGVNGIRPHGILVLSEENRKNAYAYKSKYWETCWFVENEEEGISKLLENFADEKEKPVIFPSSDAAELIIDNNISVLKEKFIIPGIKQQQGAVATLMNKKNQIQWANEIGLKTALTWELDLTKISEEKNKIQSFPCILKPVVSSEGEKKDITKCMSREELEVNLSILRNKGYNRILAQEFINKDYEVELFGCITENTKELPYLLTEHVREWPIVGGSVSCHRFITNVKYRKMAVLIL